MNEEMDIELKEEFDELLKEGAEEEKKAWTCDNDDKADWIVRKIAFMESERDRYIEGCKRMAQKYMDAADYEKKKCEQDTEWLRWQLWDYFGKVEHTKSKGKTKETYKLPSGTLTMTYPRLDFDYNSEELMDYLKDSHPEMIHKEEKPMWADVKKILQVLGDEVVDADTGEVVKGVSIKENPVKYEIK